MKTPSPFASFVKPAPLQTPISISRFSPKPLNPNLCVSRHIVADSLVVEETGNVTNSRDGNVLIPKLPLCEVHDILLGDGGDDTLDLLWAHAAAGGDDLASDILGDGGGAVKGEEDGGLELGLRALNLSLGNVGAETGPLAESEVDKVVDAVELVRDKVDTPETVFSPCQ